MAVEARQREFNLFPPWMCGNRELMMNGVEGIGSVYATPVGYGMVAPLSGATAAVMENVVPLYGEGMAPTVPGKAAAAVKSESGVTYAIPASRKRSRDSFDPLASSSPLPNGVQNQTANNRCASFTFLGEDFSFHLLQQQLEIDRYIAQHTAKLRMEVEERRKKFSRRIAVVVQANMVKRLKAKDEEIDQIGKLNFALEERVKSLCVENQILKDLAQTNEATANALRCNLEQVLAQVQVEHHQQHQDHLRHDDDAESCCGSNFEDTIHCTLPNHHHNQDHKSNASRDSIEPNSRSRMCRSCGKEESCVLLLPCRHLCLCTVCGSALHTCPVCHSAKTASVHVNLSPS